MQSEHLLRRLALVAALCASVALSACAGDPSASDSSGARGASPPASKAACAEQRQTDDRPTRTDGDGFTILRATDGCTGLALEIEDWPPIPPGVGVRFTGSMSQQRRMELAGASLGLVCRFDDPAMRATLGVVPLHWRQEFGDWGVVLMRYPASAPPFADAVRSCDLLRGTPTDNPGSFRLDPADVWTTVNLR